jgi:DNA-binding MarR family transcriptional regulator
VTGDGGADDLLDRLTFAMERVSQADRTLRFDTAFPLGVSATQLAVLRTLATAPAQRRTSSDLAADLDLSAPTISDAVAALRRKGLVDDEPAPAPAGRRRPLRPTRAGRSLLRRAARGREPLRRALGGLSAPDQADLLSALLRVIADLQREGVVTVARMCTTCRFFDDAGRVPRCQLLRVPLPPAALRVDCPEHEPAA